MAVEEELTGGVEGGAELDAPGMTWTDVAADPAEGVPAGDLLLLTGSGVAVSPDVEDVARGVAGGLAEAGFGADGGVELDGPGATWTGMVADPAEGVPVAEILLLTTSGVTALPDVEDAARGVAAGPAEAGAGADGTMGSLATVPGVACTGPAASAVGGSGLA